LKCGKDGCVVGYRNGIFDIKGLKVESVNHTGAGDVFNAAFVHSYLKDGDLERAGVFANAAGALATTKFGEERFPTEKEVDGFIDEHEQKD
jgi:sugar/nucleoside kinase (ribokinase family)